MQRYNEAKNYETHSELKEEIEAVPENQPGISSPLSVRALLA